MPRILIVDNNVDEADSLASLLQATGHHKARVARTGKAALAVAAEFLPNVVLMNLNLSDMSAYDVARMLSQHPQLQDVRLIALTDGGRHPGRERAREAGFERYLLKPVVAGALDVLLTQKEVVGKLPIEPLDGI
jgi:two-component system, chemotaxis family, CheB/CheR fusion protein